MECPVPRDSCNGAAAVTWVKELSNPRDLEPYQDKIEHQWEILEQTRQEAKEEHGRSVCGGDEPRAHPDLEGKSVNHRFHFVVTEN